MDLIIETINKCSEDFDEGVQVQVEHVHDTISANKIQNFNFFLIFFTYAARRSSKPFWSL